MTPIEELKTRLQAELPDLLRQDAGFRGWLEGLIRSVAVTPEQFDARFERMLKELADDRAEQHRLWEAQERRWEENNRRLDQQNSAWNEKWDEQSREWNAKWEENSRRWEEQNRDWNAKWNEQNREWNEKWEENSRRWDEQNRGWHEKWEEDRRRWNEQNRMNAEFMAELKASRSRQEQGIGALGARWGLASEESFRAALKGILEDSFGVEVLNINEFDDDGTVFGVPDQVEIDLIIINGKVILCELKASMSRSDLYTFERKCQYYERRHGRPVTRKLVISPMLARGAVALAERLGIEVFTYAQDATGLAAG